MDFESVAVVGDLKKFKQQVFVLLNLIVDLWLELRSGYMERDCSKPRKGLTKIRRESVFSYLPVALDRAWEVRL